MIRAIALVVFLLSSAAAQVPVTIVNTAPHDRRNVWVTVVCPDSKAPQGFGIVDPFGWSCIVGQKVGARGRFLHIRVGAIGASERLEGIARTAKASDKLAADVVAPDESAEPLVSESPAASSASPIPELVVRTPAGEQRWRPDKLALLERNLARHVFHGFGRVPGTMLVANAWFYVYAGQRSIPFELFLANCDPSTTDTEQPIEELRVRTIAGIYPAVDFLRARGGGDIVYEQDGSCSVMLARDTWLGHGQGLAFVGRLIAWKNAKPGDWLNMIAATDSPLHAIAPDWSGEWGPWRKMPELHPIENSKDRGFGLAAAAELLNRFAKDNQQTGALWGQRLAYWGTNNRPADTGDQGDFGVTGLLPALGPRGGDPVHLWELWPSVFRDASRPSFFYMLDGTPADKSSAELADWWTWGLQTHYHPSVSPYRFGKVPWAKMPSNTVLAKDFAHVSSNFLAGHAILTGSYLSRHIGRQEQEDLLAYDPHFGLGQTRAYGRAPLAFAWHYLANGDQERLQRFAEKVYNDPTFGDSVLEMAKRGWEVRVRGPLVFDQWTTDGRQLGGKYPAWLPWHQGLAIAGLDALAQVAPSKRADEILFHLCRTQIKWGWWLLDGRWTVGGAVRWQANGVPLTADQYADPTQAAPHWPGTAYDQWCHAAVRVAMRRLADREPDLAEKARKIDAALTAQWKGWRPRYGWPGFDHGSTWFTAVR